MKRFAKLLLVTVGFGVLGFVMSLAPQKSATGAAGAPVNIISSIPLSVAGTVAAQQSGNWNVGITGTPSVNVANTSAIPISGSVGINGNIPLVNPLDSGGNPIPLINRDADNGARQPFVGSCHAATPSGNPSSICSFEAPVPAGQRWVIESFTGSCIAPTGSKPLLVQLLLLTNGTTHSGYFVPILAGTDPTLSADRFVFNESLRLYADAGTNPITSLLTNDTSGKSICDFESSGYLVKLP